VGIAYVIKEISFVCRLVFYLFIFRKSFEVASERAFAGGGPAAVPAAAAAAAAAAAEEAAAVAERGAAGTAEAIAVRPSFMMAAGIVAKIEEMSLLSPKARAAAAAPPASGLLATAAAVCNGGIVCEVAAAAAVAAAFPFPALSVGTLGVLTGSKGELLRERDEEKNLQTKKSTFLKSSRSSFC